MSDAVAVNSQRRTAGSGAGRSSGRVRTNTFPGRRRSTVVIAAVMATAVAGCGIAVDGHGLTMDERLSHLRTAGRRGADAHQQLRIRDVRVDAAHCEQAYDSGGAGDDIPADNPDGSVSDIWREHVKGNFVKACLSGAFPGE
ncbi:hypothetical protein FXF51_21895 [Nonomuraea sp. PA05]|uniref:hypothetical protein n=1 Tax=Nonomuraea sp. PA05 TaxID=2604466 RepID=UPI0011DA2327|nr:hypothetical protein [Nonomuraea sp. PA05]TYB64370.1 hypothetical protein FXF51_21895 [Nonomuraea sp. PA05]